MSSRPSSSTIPCSGRWPPWKRRGEIKRSRTSPCDASGASNPDDVRRAIEPRTRLVVLTHASNVTGAIQPIAEVAAVAHDAGCQAAGRCGANGRPLPDRGRTQLGVDLLATSGHKGLLGPSAPACSTCRPGLEERIAPPAARGTGTHSDEDRQPATLPDKYESGNLNVPGILGLGAGRGISCSPRGWQTMQRQISAAATRLRLWPGRIPGVQVIGQAEGGRQRGAGQSDHRAL